MNLNLVTTRVPLTQPFRISRSTTETLEVLHVRLSDGAHVGWGEASAMPGVTGEHLDEIEQALSSVNPGDLDPEDPGSTLAAYEHLPQGARAGLDLALHDLAGHLASEPVHQRLGLPADSVPTAATVTFTDPTRAREEAEAWTRRGYRQLKVKLGGHPDDLELVRQATAALPTEPHPYLGPPEVWVDANEALDVDTALALLPKLDELGVTLVEQPLPRDDLDGLQRLLDETHIPIAVDEAIQAPEDVEATAHLEGPLGINIKVQKVGGLQPAQTCLAVARDQGRFVMVGCNIETGLGIAAGAAFCAAVDKVDLDGNLFLAHDPFPLPRSGPGHVTTPEGPGLGVHPDRRFLDAEPA